MPIEVTFDNRDPRAQEVSKPYSKDGLLIFEDVEVDKLNEFLNKLDDLSVAYEVAQLTAYGAAAPSATRKQPRTRRK